MRSTNYQVVPDTVLFFDLSSNHQNPEIIKVINLSEIISLSSLKALSVDPSKVIEHAEDKLHSQLNDLYKEMAAHPDELYYVLMVGLLNMQANNTQLALESFEYLAEILKYQNKKFIEHPDNKIICALTSYFLQTYKNQQDTLVNAWHSIKPTLKVSIEIPYDSKYFINQVFFKCSITRIPMVETDFNCFILPADFSLSQIAGNSIKLQILLDQYSDYKHHQGDMDITFHIEYGFIKDGKYMDDFAVKLI
jgi:hypothetical protein